MSDDFLVVVPKDPRHIPNPEAQRRLAAVIRELAPTADEISIDASEQISFFDAGENFERVACPRCSSELDIEWWQNQMDGDFDGSGFRLAPRVLPCCGFTATLNDLQYDWPQAFGRFSCRVRNPGIGALTNMQSESLEAAVDVPILVISPTIRKSHASLRLPLSLVVRRHSRRQVDFMYNRAAQRMTFGLIVGALIGAGALSPAAVSYAQEAVMFSTTDEGLVSADLYGSGVHGIVLAPGGRFDKSSWSSEARVLADAGFLVLAISLRGRGESRSGAAGEDAFHLDVIGAIQYLRTLGVTDISAIGASLGGWAVAEAITKIKPGEIDSIVLLAHSAIEHPEQLHGRKLFIVGREDTRGGGVRRLAEIRDQYERAPEPKVLLVLEGSAHAQLLFQTDQGEQLLRDILCFLSAPTVNLCRERTAVTSKGAADGQTQAVMSFAFAKAAPACLCR